MRSLASQETSCSRQALVVLLEHENRVVIREFVNGTGVDGAFGEAYEATLLEPLMEVLTADYQQGDPKPEVLEALLYSSYDKDSPMASWLGDQVPLVVGAALEMTDNWFLPTRVQGVGILGHVLAKHRDDLSPMLVGDIQTALWRAQSDAQPMMQFAAVDAIAESGGPGDITRVEELSRVDTGFEPSLGTYPVRDEAKRALDKRCRPRLGVQDFSEPPLDWTVFPLAARPWVCFVLRNSGPMLGYEQKQVE
jgi:hypothetical protein